MDNKDKKRFSDLMLGMADNFRDTITKEGMTLRWGLLKGYSIEQVESACLKIIRKRKYTKMPPIAEFIEAIDGEHVPVELIAEEQWTNVVMHLGNTNRLPMASEEGLVYPPDPTDDIEDPVTKHLCKRRFTPGFMGMSLTKDMPFIRKEFIAAYCSENVKRDQHQIEYGGAHARLKAIAGSMLKSIEDAK